MTKTADLLGVGSGETVRQWVRKMPTVSPSSAAASDAAEQIRRLKKENAELKRTNSDSEGCVGLFRGRDRPATPLIA